MRISWLKYSHKNTDRRRSYHKKWYQENRENRIKQIEEYRKTPQGRLVRKKSEIKKMLKNPEKYQARQEVLKALRKGVLIKQPCEVCGSKYSQAHHEDYSKPLVVIWLCKKHHDERTFPKEVPENEPADTSNVS